VELGGKQRHNSPFARIIASMRVSESDLTRLLQDWSRGDAAALETLVLQVFDDLRGIARGFLRGGAAETLQPTALVNELFPKLLRQQHAEWQNREQFFAVSKMLMRRILQDYLKAKRSAKRGGSAAKTTP
jgi:RNA polymerase sigma factor (TIGR02999 family)